MRTRTINRPHPRCIGLGETKVVNVKPHNRTIHERIYQFICPECDRAVTRPTFGSCPKYCLECSPPKVNKKKSAPGDLEKLLNASINQPEVEQQSLQLYSQQNSDNQLVS